MTSNESSIGKASKESESLLHKGSIAKTNQPSLTIGRKLMVEGKSRDYNTLRED